jgi:hypothetical protein
MGKIVESRQSVSKEVKASGEVKSTEFEQKSIGSYKFSEDPTMVECSLGMTVNLGNYEFLRVDVGLNYPCNKDEIDATYEKVFSIVGAELFKRVEEARSTLK